MIHYGSSRKATIPTDSHSVISLLTNDHAPDLLARTVAKTSNGIKDTGWDFFLQCVPSYVGIPGNEMADALVSSAHHHESSVLFLKPFLQAREVIKATVPLQHPDDHLLLFPSRIDVSVMLSAPYCIAFELIVCSRSQFLNGLDVRIAPNCASCGTLEDMVHVLQWRPSYLQELLATWRFAARSHMTT